MIVPASCIDIEPAPLGTSTRSGTLCIMIKIIGTSLINSQAAKSDGSP